MATAILTAARLRELLSYDHDSGDFRWRGKPRQSVNVGDVAGYVTSAGYVRIKIENSRYMAHRLAWLYVYGDWPAGEIDHINGVQGDNKIFNLRILSRRGNQHSQTKVPVNSKSGERGVTQKGGRFVARIFNDGASINLGTYNTKMEAKAAYWTAKKRLHPEVVERINATAADRGVELDYMEYA